MKLKISALMIFALCVFNVPAFARGGDVNEMYTLTIPETITATSSGWNAFEGGISLKANSGLHFPTANKLVISADSANGWALVLSPDKKSSIGYYLTTAEGSTSSVTEFEYSAASIDEGVSQNLGIIISDYTGKTAGTYQDTITFRAGVQDATSAGNTVDLSTLTANYEAQDGDILTGKAGSNAHITIAAGATITLKDATITSITNSDSYSWAGITPLGDATIILEGTNSVKGGYEDYPGIFAAVNSTLTIKGDGSLTASSGGNDDQYGAGIGGGYDIACGNIVIEGGTITATSSNAAGIGGGLSDSGYTSCGDITISGGTITATGGDYAAGIGGGYKSSCGNITISGGTIEAAGGNYAAGIGSGYYASCGNITITSGVTSVTATKGEDAPNSIGAGKNGSCDGVIIGGKAVGNISESPYTYKPGN